MYKRVVVFAVLCSLSTACASSQNVVAVFEELGVAAPRTAVVYNFAYATKKGGDQAELATLRAETTLVPAPWTDGESIAILPGEMFEVDPPATGPLTLTKSLPAGEADVVWVRRGLPQLETLLDESGTWVWEKHFWDIAYDLMIDAYSRQGTQPGDFGLVAIEPSYAAEHAGYLDKMLAYVEDQAEGPGVAGGGPTTQVVAGPSPVWPSGETSWQLGSGYTELSDAQAALRAKAPAPYRVKIAHLDSGYFPGDQLKPRRMLPAQESRNFIGEGSPQGDISGLDSSHGARTLSTLAGGRATIVDAAGATLLDADIGAFPEASVAEYRISRKLPIHINAGRMAQAIFTAADKSYDVVTISAGGLPSLVQRDAVTFAYLRGTAIVAATGDFFTVPFGPSTPKSVVFPARYNRVLGVAGVTADGKSYGLDPCAFCFFKGWKSWGLRGSYGPACEMAGHTISGYAPNITHSAGTLGNPNAIAHSGAGTSHATPQVAAAAAMWLEYHHDELAGVSESWRRSEAVYTALLASADASLGDYDLETMGEGTIKARRALDTTVDLQALCQRESNTVGLKWIKDVAFRGGVPGGHDERLSAFLKEMLFTELQQLLFLSEAATDVLAKLRFAKAAGSCTHRYVLEPQPGDARGARRLVGSLLKLKMSKRLREALSASLQSLPAG